MNAKKAKELGFTHYVSMYGINGFGKFEDDDGIEFRATWWIADIISALITRIDALVMFHKEGFKVVVWGEIE